jgi:predicted permease
VRAQQVEGNFDGMFRQSAREGFDSFLSSLPPQQRGSSAYQNRTEVPHLNVSSASRGLYDLDPKGRQSMALMSVVVALILLIVCANVANLLLSRAATRQKEISVRMSMGATRLRLMRQLLTESVIVALLGGTLGIAVAHWGKQLLPGPAAQARLDWPVLAFTGALSLITGILFGFAPALRATSKSLNDALKETGRSVIGSRTILTKGLLILQIAISLVLLVGAGLFLQTIRNLREVSIGFDPENIVLFRLNPQLNRYDQARIGSLYAQIQERLSALPGVRTVAVANMSLLSGGENITGFVVQGRPVPPADSEIHTVNVGPNYFETLGIPLLIGRTFTVRDDQSAPKVAIINEAAAHRYFPNENPIGRRFGGRPEESDQIEIVGVVRDAKYNSLRDAAPPTQYMPFFQNRLLGGVFHVKTTGDPTLMIPAIREAVRQIDPNLPVTNVSTQMEQIEGRFAQEKLFAQAYTLFGSLALLIASIGLFGLMSYSVTRRTNEIGIRMALGALPSDVVQMVMRESLVLVSFGLILGLATALAAGRLVKTLLFGLRPADASTIILSVVIMIAVSAFAGYLPARRASRVDPMVALHYE